MRTIPLALNSLCAALCIGIATQQLQAQTLQPSNDVPRTVSFQGALTNPNGSSVPDGQYSITLSLYADPTGSVRLWQDTYTTSVSGGIFNLYLGSGTTPLPDQATMNRPLWIGMQIDGADDIPTLTPLSSSPYALNVADRAITTAKLADGAVTADKVDMNYIGGILVNGQPVSAKGTLLNLEGSEEIALTYNDQTNTLRLSRPTPATRGDGEKGTTALAGTGTDVVWSMTGDAWDIAGAASVAPAAGDWIGTSATSGATFEMRTNGETIMRYQPNGTNTPNVVGGYSGNSVTTASKGGVIAGGGAYNDVNVIDNDANYAVIGGGSFNTVSNNHSTIGGGYGNLIINGANYSVIGSGTYNTIDTGQYGTIGGGTQNKATAVGATIGGGYDNRATGRYSVVAGGYDDSATAFYSAVGGGRHNTSSDTGAFVGGGYANKATYNFSAIGGGFFNQARNDFSFVGGGDSNLACGTYSVVGGGKLDTAAGNYSAIVAGKVNRAWGTGSFIGAGENNVVNLLSDYSTVVGGYSNQISSEAQYSFIGGGNNNEIGSNASVIGGGENNTSSINYTTIGGGIQNTVDGYSGTIAGGENNRISGTGTKGFIGGGQNHNVTNSMGVVAGGREDTASGYAAAVGGGSTNRASGDYSAIPGGNNLQATKYAQSAVGFYNAPRGSITGQPTTGGLNNDPLFMVGNGTSPVGGTPIASNAFEVSYNGHTTVYGTNGGANNPIYGSTYKDNIVYAWGDIGVFGAINSDFGVVNVNHPAAGVYIITINVVDPVTGNPIILNNAAITATLAVDPNDPNPGQFRCSDIRVTRMGVPGANQFTVYTIGAPTNGHCEGVNSAFMFHVTGRR